MRVNTQQVNASIHSLNGLPISTASGSDIQSRHGPGPKAAFGFHSRSNVIRDKPTPLRMTLPWSGGETSAVRKGPGRGGDQATALMLSRPARCMV